MLLAEIAKKPAEPSTLERLYAALDKAFEEDDGQDDTIRLKGLDFDMLKKEIEVHAESHRTETDYFVKLTLVGNNVKLTCSNLDGLGTVDLNPELSETADSILGRISHAVDDDDDDGAQDDDYDEDDED